MQFKAEVTLGTIVSTVALIGTGVAGWSSNKERIQHVETEVLNLKETDKEIKAASIEYKNDIIKRLDEIKADVRDIRNNQRSK